MCVCEYMYMNGTAEKGDKCHFYENLVVANFA